MYGTGPQPGNSGAFGSSGMPMGNQMPGSVMGGALPSTQSMWPWMSNYLSGFGLPSNMGANGLPNIGLPGSPPAQPSQPPTPSLPPLPNAMGSPSGGMMGMPYWMQMLRMGAPQRPQLPPITAPSQAPGSLPGRQIQASPPRVAPIPSPAAPTTPSILTNPLTGQPLSVNQNSIVKLLMAQGVPQQDAINNSLFQDQILSQR